VIGCSELFWQTFWSTLGVFCGILPFVVLFWGGLGAWWYLSERRAAADRRLAHCVAYLEGRLLPFDEARRQREG
jgi:hypothetical protein